MLLRHDSLIIGLAKLREFIRGILIDGPGIRRRRLQARSDGLIIAVHRLLESRYAGRQIRRSLPDAGGDGACRSLKAGKKRGGKHRAEALFLLLQHGLSLRHLLFRRRKLLFRFLQGFCRRL